jgi:hypothetical protein
MTTATLPDNQPKNLQKKRSEGKLILAALIEGKWIETEYDVGNPVWRESVKVFRDLNVTFRLAYK